MAILGQGGFRVFEFVFDERPEVLDGGHVGHANPAGAASLDGHVAQGHARFHAHPVDDRPPEFDHPVGRPIDSDLADDEQDDVLGVNSFGQGSGQIDANGRRLAKGADPLEDADFQVGGADAGGKGAECAVGAGVAVAHDHREAWTDVPLLGKYRMTDAIVADVEKVGDLVTAGPVAQHLRLQRGFAVLRRGDVVNDRFDLVIVENPVLVPRLEVGNSHRGGDFVAQHPIEVEHLGAGKRLVTQVRGEDFFGDGLSHTLSFDFCSIIQPGDSIPTRHHWQV